MPSFFPIPRIIFLLGSLLLTLAVPVAAIGVAGVQTGTAVAAGTPAADPIGDPTAIVDALDAAEPPATLPGTADDPVVLLSWEEMYGDALEGAPGAWVLDGDLEFPLATVIVFDTPEEARLGLIEFEGDDARVTVRGADAWTVADRAKWICITTSGPMLVIGQALPVTTAEPEADVRARACAVLDETLGWLEEDVLHAPLATPLPRPTSEGDED